MKAYRATVWILTSAAEAVYGYAGVQRRILELEADSRDNFEAQVRDLYCHTDVDCDVSFGPISVKEL